MKKSGSNTETKITRKYERTEIIFRGNLIYGKIPTEALGTNRPTTQIIEKERTLEIGRRTAERLRKTKRMMETQNR